MREQGKPFSIEPIGYYDKAAREPESILAEVLSYFPEQEELFVKIQDYVARRTGVRGLQFSVYHGKTNMGFDGKRLFEAGQFEDLSLHGNMGQHLLPVISEIKILRGEKHPERPYVGSPVIIENILKVVDSQDKEGLEIRDKMIAKLLEVMKIDEKDIALMREYLQAINERGQLMTQVYALQKEVDKLPAHERVLPTEKMRAQADKVVREVVEKIETRYPRELPK